MTLDAITSDLLQPLQHGFFTRKGGSSSGIFHGLNCGPGSSDQSQAVAMNRARVADAMQVAPEHLLSVHQIHSADVVTVSDPDSPRPRADAMVTATPGLALGILTADCQPVLFADPAAGVVGAAHAGWKGALGGVLEATIDAMEALGAERANMSAVIGPCISQRAMRSDRNFSTCSWPTIPANNRFLPRALATDCSSTCPASVSAPTCVRAGVGEAEWTGHCTYSRCRTVFQLSPQRPMRARPIMVG